MNNNWQPFRTAPDGFTQVPAGTEVVLRDDIAYMGERRGTVAVVLKVNPKSLAIWVEGDDLALNVYPEHVAGHRPGSADRATVGLAATAGKPRYWISHGKRGYNNS